MFLLIMSPPFEVLVVLNVSCNSVLNVDYAARCGGDRSIVAHNIIVIELSVLVLVSTSIGPTRVY